VPEYVVWITDGEKIRFLSRIDGEGRAATRYAHHAVRLPEHTAWDIAEVMEQVIDGQAFIMVARA